MNFKKTTQVANKLKGPIVVINIFLQGTHLFFFCVNLYLSSSLHLNFFLYSHSFLLTLPQSAAIITQNKDLRLSQVFQLLMPARIWSDGLRHAAVVANSTNPPQVCRSGLAFRVIILGLRSKKRSRIVVLFGGAKRDDGVNHCTRKKRTFKKKSHGSS
ncbi:hypothetical protein BDC45DRAFT_501205 [Circinella umbellata]|nr:hypothetical protein BDC45DRAFT_501205 [Circinella umbellata]